MPNYRLTAHLTYLLSEALPVTYDARVFRGVATVTTPTGERVTVRHTSRGLRAELETADLPTVHYAPDTRALAAWMVDRAA